MSDIAIELIIILLLATAIGWFLGRFLTKNKEVEERSTNRQLNKQIQTINAELTNSHQQFEQAQIKTNDSSKQAAELQQQVNNFEVRQQTLQTERKSLLTKLHDVEISHSKLELVSQEYNAQTKSMITLKADHAEQANARDNLQIELNHRQQQLDNTTQEAKQQLEQLSETRKENSQQADFIHELEKDRQALKLLTLDHDETLSKINMLEEDKASLHQRHTELRSEHQDLRLQCETLRSDSLKFNDRFSNLMDEKEALIQTIERLNIEKNDYLGRLRAISGVIDVVGTEKLSSDTSNQEFIPRQAVIVK